MNLRFDVNVALDGVRGLGYLGLKHDRPGMIVVVVFAGLIAATRLVVCLDVVVHTTRRSRLCRSDLIRRSRE